MERRKSPRRPRSGSVYKGSGRRRRAASERLRVAHSGELGWLTDEGRRSAAALLVEVVQGRMIVLSDEAPPVRTPVCVRLTWPLATHWMAGTLIERNPTRIGPIELTIVPSHASTSAVLATLAGDDPEWN